jgi:hypothetical protein
MVIPLDEPTRQLTVRMPERLLTEARRIAAQRGTSLNALMRASLERLAREERQATLRTSYDLLGAISEDERDVEAFFDAQADAAADE